MGHLFKERRSNGGLRDNWSWRFKDPHGAWRKIALLKNKRASEDIGRKIDDLIAHRVAGSPLPPDLADWVTAKCAPDLRNRLEKFGIIAKEQATQLRSLTNHLSDWRDELTIHRGAQYASTRHNRALVLFERCNFIDYADLDAHRATVAVGEMRAEGGRSDSTINAHLAAAKGFCEWMVNARRAKSNPLKLARGIPNPRRVRDRRALTIDEARRLIRAAEEGPPVRGVDGGERAMIYRIAMETGLRADELGSMTVASFDFDGVEPTCVVEEAYTKNRRRAVVVLRPELAQSIRAFFIQERRVGAARAFRVSDQTSSRFVDADRKAAKIPKRDGAGRQVDFHALRHTFGTNLHRAGVHPRTAQELMRHGTIDLTMRIYTHVAREDEIAAIHRLPDLNSDESKGHETGQGGAS